jgi:hypothetical protein
VSPESLVLLQSSTRNQTIAQFLLQSKDLRVDPAPNDWVITMIFYGALHAIDAYAIEMLGENPRTHRYRNWLVRSDPMLSGISTEYLRLGELSRTARYNPLPEFSPSIVRQAFDDLEFIPQVVSETLEQPK